MNKETFQRRVKALVERNNVEGALHNWAAPVFQHHEAQNCATLNMEGAPASFYIWNNVHSDAVYLQTINHETGQRTEATRAAGLEMEPEEWRQ